jgi:hypothetical protein
VEENMRNSQIYRIQPNRLSFAVSLALASLVASHAAMAQQAQAQGNAAPAANAP